MTRSLMKPEAGVQAAVLQLLAAMHILAWRMNTGAVVTPPTETTRRRFHRYGTPGMADILAAPIVHHRWTLMDPMPGQPVAFAYTAPALLWIECKSDVGRQSATQQSFAEQVKQHGQHYLLARSVEDVQAWLKTHSARGL